MRKVCVCGVEGSFSNRGDSVRKVVGNEKFLGAVLNAVFE